MPSLSLTNLAKLYHTAEDIDERLQIDPSPAVKIPLDFSAHAKYVPAGPRENAIAAREDALKLLQNRKAVSGWEFILRDPLMTSVEDLLGTFTESIRVDVDIAKFREIKPQIIEAFLAKESGIPAPEKGRGQTDKRSAPQQPQDRDTDLVYEVKFTAKREILVNDFLLTQLEFNSENDNVFKYLYEHPNRIISVKELEKQLGGESLKKSLHKIVENLGFTRELKDAFFGISKTSILFRNPLARKELDSLGISRIRLPRR